MAQRYQDNERIGPNSSGFGRARSDQGSPRSSGGGRFEPGRGDEQDRFQDRFYHEAGQPESMERGLERWQQDEGGTSSRESEPRWRGRSEPSGGRGTAGDSRGWGESQDRSRWEGGSSDQSWRGRVDGPSRQTSPDAAHRSYGNQDYGNQDWGRRDWDQRDWERGAGRERGAERGFMERASDEIASWMGNEDATRRREQDHRGKGPRGYQRSDERIQDDVNDRLSDDPHIDASDISVSVSSGEVTLNGEVASKPARRHAEDCADSVSGVRYVQNNLRVRGASASVQTEGQRMGAGVRPDWAAETATDATNSGTSAQPTGLSGSKNTQA